MYTEIAFEATALQKISNGVNTLADAVETTLGPEGNLVLLGTNPVRSTKDGVTVARAIKLKDPMEELGATVVRDASLKTAEEVGDGTTTTVVFTRSLFNSLFDSGASVDEIKEVRKEANRLIEVAKTMIRKDIPLRDVALVSANGDEMVADLVAGVQEKIGVDGTAVIEESRAVGIRTEVFGGFLLPIGILSHAFVNDARSTRAEFDNVPVAIFKGKVNYLTQLSAVLEQCVKAKSPIVIVAEDFSDEVVSTVLLNKQNGILRIALVRHLDVFENLKDLAISVGATIIHDSASDNDLGFCDKFSGDMKSCTFIRVEDSEEVDSLTAQLKEQLKEENDQDRIKALEGRIANLNGKAAIIKVGAATVSETKELKDRVEDAVCAVRSAARHGVLLGGGKTMDTLGDHTANEHLKNALCVPMSILGTYGKHVEIYDPAMATIKAIENGVSACSILMNTRVLIVPKMEEKDNER